MSNRLVCEFCETPAIDERPDRGGRTMLVCDFCAEDLDLAAKRAKAADIEECRGDYERDSRKMEFDR